MPGRIRKSWEFKKVFRHGERHSGRNVRVWVLRGQADRRLGVIVPKAAARSAVRRNRLKRVIRESWRAGVGEVAEGAWVVVSVGREAADEASVLCEFWEALRDHRAGR